MTSIILKLLLFAMAIMVIFFITRRLVMLWTGIDKEEAAKEIWAFMKQKQVYHIADDIMLLDELWFVIRSVLGETRYADLTKLSYVSQLYSCGYASGLPFLAFTVPYQNNNEKYMVENLLGKKLSGYLSVHGYNSEVLIDWKENGAVKIPCIMLRYAETSEQIKILKAVRARDSEKIANRYQPVIDEDLENDESDISRI